MQWFYEQESLRQRRNVLEDFVVSNPDDPLRPRAWTARHEIFASASPARRIPVAWRTAGQLRPQPLQRPQHRRTRFQPAQTMVRTGNQVHDNHTVNYRDAAVLAAILIWLRT